LSAVESEAGRIVKVRLDNEWIPTDFLINAAGAWAGAVGRIADAAPIALRALRRHLFVTGPLSWVDKRWPFVWDVSHGFYFRPDSGGLLLCPCDEDEMAPCDTPTAESAVELLADKTRSYFPGFGDLPIMKSWAGLRTFTPDGRFVVGWDPQVTNFFWVAGLGGHGVTTSAAVGALAADVILAGGSPLSKDLAPARFMQTFR
jgi:D-arginine dehydrogenase